MKFLGTPFFIRHLQWLLLNTLQKLVPYVLPQSWNQLSLISMLWDNFSSKDSEKHGLICVVTYFPEKIKQGKQVPKKKQTPEFLVKSETVTQMSFENCLFSKTLENSPENAYDSVLSVRFGTDSANSTILLQIDRQQRYISEKLLCTTPWTPL